MKRLAVAAAAITLTGCAHAIVLTPEDGVGPVGRGTAPATAINNFGQMSVDLAGRHYAGEWTLQANDGFAGSGVGVSGSQVAVGSFVGASTNGNGRAYLTEPGGGSLSCQFSYSAMSYTGVGACRAETGKLYTMTLH